MVAAAAISVPRKTYPGPPRQPNAERPFIGLPSTSILPPDLVARNASPL